MDKLILLLIGLVFIFTTLTLADEKEQKMREAMEKCQKNTCKEISVCKFEHQMKEARNMCNIERATIGDRNFVEKHR